MERSGTFSHIEEPDAVMGLLRRFFDAGQGARPA
jgi:hypothetical protein